MSNITSPWALAASSFFEDEQQEVLRLERDDYSFTGYLSQDSFFIKVNWPTGGQLVFRPIFSGGAKLSINDQRVEADKEITLTLDSVIGKFELLIALPQSENTLFHYQATLTPHQDLVMPFWPRDIIATAQNGSIANNTGQVLVKQVLTRSGQIYFHLTRPKAGAVLYLQNLSSLNNYCEQTQTSAGDLVGGDWPELGLTLPPNGVDKPLAKGKAVIISDAYVAFAGEVPGDEAEMSRQYLDLLAALYLQLPKPETSYRHWPEILDKGLVDLLDNPGCWSHVDGNQYFNAYVSDYATPPEVMVQLAVLLPLVDYVEWSGKTLDVIKTIKKGLPAFYDKELKTLMRWHPAKADTLEGEEEQKEPHVMDSWYLHHPLLNLSRLALKGDKEAEQLLLDSLDFAIKVAHHFNYNWPVFYNIKTLDVIKAETSEGEGGENDVPGLYALVMLQAWELTGEKRYLNEAEKAVQYLKGTGFSLMYQANNTAFAAGALLRMYKITKKEEYLDLSYLCLANLFKNVRLWDCDYGNGKNFPSFFTMFPLDDAPYSAVYEEQEVFCAFHDYLHHAKDVELLPSARLLLAEYIRYLVERAVYYYPPALPKEMLQTKPKIGEIDPNLWIAVEDLHDGWECAGVVGQEVYGAGNAFGILPRHYIQVNEEEMLIYTDYPVDNYTANQGKPVRFKLAGDARIPCRLMIIKTGRKKLPEVTVTQNKKEVKGKAVADGNREYIVQGDADVKITW